MRLLISLSLLVCISIKINANQNHINNSPSDEPSGDNVQDEHNKPVMRGFHDKNTVQNKELVFNIINSSFI